MADNLTNEPRGKSLRGWAIVIACCIAVAGWGLLNYALVKDRDASASLHRTWDYSSLPQAPGESVYSSATPAPEPNMPQIEPLPEAKAPTTQGGRQ